MKLSSDVLKKMINALAATHQDEIGCDECFEQLSEFAERKLAGKSPEKAMPLVQDHLMKCKDCREEFDALLDALREIRQK